jgi:hypothetical protein
MNTSMRIGYAVWLAVFAGLAFAGSGCQRKVDPAVELEKAAQALAAETPAPSAAATARPVAMPAQEMNQALSEYKSGNLPTAVVRLQTLRAAPAMSPQQRIVVNEAMAAVMTEVYALAAKGDARAIHAVRQYERMQTQ